MFQLNLFLKNSCNMNSTDLYFTVKLFPHNNLHSRRKVRSGYVTLVRKAGSQFPQL